MLILPESLERMWGMRVMVIPMADGALGTAPKGLDRRLEQFNIRGRINTIQNTIMLRLVSILRRIPET